jgi:two-component system, OmpR family, response regulator VicR
MHKKILVVDDQQDMLYMMEKILSKSGFEVVTNSTGNVMEFLQGDFHPDLIILDINLGEKDGGEICHELKMKEATKHIPVILVSAVMDLLKISGDCGAEDYLAKPFRAPQLINKVLSNLEAA